MADVEALQVAVARTCRRATDLELSDDDPLGRKVRAAADRGLDALSRFAEALNTADGPQKKDHDGQS